MKYFYTFSILLFTQMSFSDEIYIGAMPDIFKDSQRHFTEDECENNSRHRQDNNSKILILINLNVAEETATVSVGVNKGEGFTHANIWEFPRPGKKEMTKVSKDKFEYEIREQGEITHYLRLNRVNLSGEFWSKHDIAPCSDSSYAKWDEGASINEKDFKSDYGLTDIVLRNTFLDTTYEMMYKELKKF